MRRANGEGSIFKSGDRYKVSISVTGIGGRRRRITRNARTRSDAVAILARLRSDIDSGGYRDPSRLTVGEFLDHWVEEHVAAHNSPSTAAVTRSMIKNYIAPHVGGLMLQKFRTADAQAFVDGLVRRQAPGRSRQMAFATLRRSMRHARKLGLIGVDPTEEIAPPSHMSKEMRPFTQVETAKLFAATEGTRWHALIVLAITGGFRQGELFGLEWSSVDLKNRKIHVCQAAAEVRGAVTIRPTKTKGSMRTVEITPRAVEALKTHRGILLKEGNAGNRLVFPAREGGLIPRSTFRHRYWLPILALDQLQLPARGFHNCRHTYATLALGAGTPPHVVAKILGHAKPSTTLDIYSHVLQTHQAAATEVMQRMFG